MKVGITGQIGFLGTHLYNYFGIHKDIERVPFNDSFFQDSIILKEFVRSCDVIVHLAAVNRHDDPKVVYDTNIRLVNQLIEVLVSENVTPHVIFASSTQENKDNLYGKSKYEGRKLLENWANDTGARFSGLLVPNIYGPFGRPYYNSFVATFCHQLTHGEQTQIQVDCNIKLIYVGSLVRFIHELINTNPASKISKYDVPFDFEMKVSEILVILNYFKGLYFEKGIIPSLKDINEVNLFNTYRSFIDQSNHFPVKLLKHEDERGFFVETIKLGVGGQVSFSTTLPGITRGNHYHTRKIERFTVIKGKARIQLRKIGCDEIINFELDGKNPSYVDMPIWYTHNISNIGDEELYTQFWINEWFNPEDGDTFFEKV